MTEPTTPSDPPPGRVIRVLRGRPSEDELAALVTALVMRAAGESDADLEGVEGRAAWRDRARYLRTTLPHGAGAWRASAWPS